MNLLQLTGPIKNIGAHKAEFDQLQGNILKSHGRDHAAHIFITFHPGQQAAARAWKNALIARHRITTAGKQIADAKAHREHGSDGGLFLVLLLSVAGYQYFGHDPSIFNAIDPNARFSKGMQDSNGILADPPVDDWEAEFRTPCHALVIVADIRPALVAFIAEEIILEIGAFADAFVVTGNQRRNLRGDAIEHFGYVDGRSQPLFFEDDLEDEMEGTSLWDPRAAPKQVLVQDPLGTAGLGWGSFFVFRKLEQNVREFKLREQSLATALGLEEDDREIAGTFVIGRFEDGTPVMLAGDPLIETSGEESEKAVPNNFNYDRDPNGLRCPIHAHIRKTNPRGSIKDLAGSKAAQMARRGITYGLRLDDGDVLPLLPDRDVGLLFMSYQADISQQFEVMQRFWANNADFPQAGTGIDPVIGQTPSSQTQWPLVWGNAGTAGFDFSTFVTLKGGDYFFSPSIAGLQAV